MSWQTKIVLGPARAVACNACGQSVSVSWAATAATMIPIVVGIIIGGIIPILVGALLSAPLQLFWVPLVPR
jgi:hypothetical protein